jgi:lysophospholipase L1-like esterase
MLGTNDLKARFSVSAYDIARSVGTLIQIVQASGSGRGGGVPGILVLAPPPLGRLTEYADMFTGGPEKSRQLGGRYREVCEEYGVAFFDTAPVVSSSDIDGIHWEKGAHAALGAALAGVVTKMA